MDALSSFSRGALFNVALQASVRLFSFVLNAALLRYVDKDLLGVVNVRLTLLYTTLLFCVREPFRKAFLTAPDLPVAEWRRRINVIWLCPLVCAGAAAVTVPIWIYVLEAPDPKKFPYYATACMMFGLAAVIETIGEPFWIIGQSLLRVRAKVAIEVTYIFVRHILFFTLTVYNRDLSLLAAGFSILVSCTLYAVSYQWYAIMSLSKSFPSLRDLYPKIERGLDLTQAALCFAFFKHSIVKQLLTEGERYVMTVFGVLNFSDQGLYDVINNLGSLVPRLVFAPVEESAYTYFSNTVDRTAGKAQLHDGKFVLVVRTLQAMLRFVVLLGLVIFVFGIPYSYLALKLYGGEQWIIGGAPRLLRFYCVYIPLLAVNGITECFALATMSQGDVEKHRTRLVYLSVVYLLVSLLLVKLFALGGVGFIAANCLNMLFRIVVSCVYIADFFVASPYVPLNSLVPRAKTAGALAFSFLATCLSSVIFCCDGYFNSAAHVCVGLVCLLATLGIVWTSEVDFVDFICTHIVPLTRHRKST